VLWRKLFPDERGKADSNLISQTYELLVHGNYEVASILLDFACDLPKFSEEVNRLIFTINRAQAYKWLGNTQKCNDILKATDWSAAKDELKLGESVLREDWADATSYMHKIGKAGGVSQADYRDWPLFKNFRKEAAFQSAYEEIFGTPFALESEVKEGLMEVEKGSTFDASTKEPPSTEAPLPSAH
jgi:hypothetical protein